MISYITGRLPDWKIWKSGLCDTCHLLSWVLAFMYILIMPNMSFSVHMKPSFVCQK